AGSQKQSVMIPSHSDRSTARASSSADASGPRCLASADDEFDCRLSIGGGRSVPLDDTGRDGLRAQLSLLDQGHDLGKQRSSMCPSDEEADPECVKPAEGHRDVARVDRKSTRLNSSHQIISYAVFCLKKKSNPEDNN